MILFTNAAGILEKLGLLRIMELIVAQSATGLLIYLLLRLWAALKYFVAILVEDMDIGYTGISIFSLLLSW